MNFVAHQRAQALVHHLVTGQRPDTCKLLADNDGGVVRVVTALHFDRGAFEPRFNKCFDFCWFHFYSDCQLVNDGAQEMENAPWMLVFPSLFLAATLFCFNFIGDGLRDALDPRDRSE